MTYCITVNNFLSKDECTNIIDRYKDQELFDGKIKGGTEVDTNYRKSKINFYNIDDVSKKVYQKVTELIKFQNSVFNPIVNFQFTKYEVGDYYKWHLDYSSIREDLKNRYISVVILLNDDFEGGDLEYKTNLGGIDKFDKGVGNLFIFNSSIEHRVTEIVKGVRYSLVSWLTIKQSNFVKTLL